jgi:hypothetical protein
MGGYGSGRHWSSKETTADYKQLDVRHLQRDGLLERRWSFNVKWTRNGRPTGDINIRPESDRVILLYRTRERDGGEEWTHHEYPVMLERTPCHYGGERVWFRCPVIRCGKRVASLYGGAIFACRHCRRLAYESQRESVSDRADRKAWKIRERCKDDFGNLLEPLFKPKGMHERTFRRLVIAYDRACQTSQWAFATHLGISVEELLSMSKLD